MSEDKNVTVRVLNTFATGDIKLGGKVYQAGSIVDIPREVFDKYSKKQYGAVVEEVKVVKVDDNEDAPKIDKRTKEYKAGPEITK